MGTYELHAHTVASDGGDEAVALVESAAHAGLAGIAITDHDTMASVPEAVEAGARLGVEVIAGVEVTAHEGPFECHILGYFVRPRGGPLDALLRATRRARVERAREMLRRLRAQGLPVTEEELVRAHGPRAASRAAIASVLAAKGLARDIRDAMRTHLRRGTPADVPPPAIDPEKAVRTIAEDGGVPVFAHPGMTGLDRVIERLVSFGLIGVEVGHPGHSPEDERHYAALAERLGLVATAGSDYHGSRGLGATGLGAHAAPSEIVERLRSHALSARAGPGG